MSTTLLLFIKIFLFVFSILIVIKNIYSFIKVMYMRQGKIDASRTSEIIFGCAVSYIITILIIGF